MLALWRHRSLPARLPLLHCGAHPVDENAECREHGEIGQGKAQGSPGLMGIGTGSVWIDEEGDPYGGGRDDQADARPGGRPGQRPTAHGGRGRRAGPPAAGSPGMSAVSAASSARVRAASARPARTSSSSLVSRPCTNASFNVSITCSRSAWPALSRSRPAAAGSSGPVITGTPSHDTAKRNAPAPQRPCAALSALQLRGATDTALSSTFSQPGPAAPWPAGPGKGFAAASDMAPACVPSSTVTALSSTFNHRVDEWITCDLEYFQPLS